MGAGLQDTARPDPRLSVHGGCAWWLKWNKGQLESTTKQSEVDKKELAIDYLNVKDAFNDCLNVEVTKMKWNAFNFFLKAWG